MTSELNDAKKALSSQKHLRERSREAQEYQNKLTQAQAHELNYKRRRGQPRLLREAEARVGTGTPFGSLRQTTVRRDRRADRRP